MSRYRVSSEPVKVEVWVRDLPGTVQILSDEEAAPFISKEKADPSVRVEYALWQEPAWGVQQLINENSRRLMSDGRLVFDMQRYTASQVLYLLKGWSLGEQDPTLKLTTIVPPGVHPKDGITVLNDASMSAVRSVRREVVDAFITKGLLAIYHVAEGAEAIPPG